MINLKQNYNIQELAELYGSFWAQDLGLYSMPKKKNKSEIFTFEDFDKQTQEIYKKIYFFIIEKNLNSSINMWAIGSRILGTWRTREESNQLAEDYKLKKVKYSDYDFLTDASYLPSNKEIELFIGDNDVKVDGRCFPESLNPRKVLISF